MPASDCDVERIDIRRSLCQTARDRIRLTLKCRMDFLFWLKVIILGAVEGFTEFLPISSTGHLIVAGQLLGFNDEKGKIFEIVIQTGAMLAIVWEYRRKFVSLLTGVT